MFVFFPPSLIEFLQKIFLKQKKKKWPNHHHSSSIEVDKQQCHAGVYCTFSTLTTDFLIFLALCWKSSFTRTVPGKPVHELISHMIYKMGKMLQNICKRCQKIYTTLIVSLTKLIILKIGLKSSTLYRRLVPGIIHLALQTIPHVYQGLTRQLGRQRSPANSNKLTFFYIYIGYRFPLSLSTIWGNHLPLTSC